MLMQERIKRTEGGEKGKMMAGLMRGEIDGVMGGCQDRWTVKWQMNRCFAGLGDSSAQMERWGSGKDSVAHILSRRRKDLLTGEPMAYHS
jgi:hypothetical protein